MFPYFIYKNQAIPCYRYSVAMQNTAKSKALICCFPSRFLSFAFMSSVLDRGLSVNLYYIITLNKSDKMAEIIYDFIF